MEEVADTRIKERDQAAQQVNGMDSGDDEEKRDAGIGGEGGIHLLEQAPGIDLAGKEAAAQQNRRPQPRQRVIFADADAGNVGDGASTTSCMTRRRATSRVTLLSRRIAVLRSITCTGNVSATQWLA